MKESTRSAANIVEEDNFDDQYNRKNNIKNLVDELQANQ